MTTTKYVVADVSDDPKAPSLVRVSDALRQSVIALGCTPVGYIGSNNREIDMAFVVEVFSRPTAPVVIATYNIGSWGEGLALWTMLDDGTIVTTERFGRDMRLWAVMTRLFPLHRTTTRFFNHVHAGSPERILRKHFVHVRAVTRRNAKPVDAPALTLYAAMRIRSGDLMGPQISEYIRTCARIQKGLVIGLVAPFVLWALAIRGARAAIAVAGPTLIIAAIVSGWVAPRLASLLLRSSRESLPPSPEDLLERAAKIPRCTFASISAREPHSRSEID